jgi:HemY protein
MNEQSVYGHLALAGEAIEQSLWGEARESLKRAEDIQPAPSVYKMHAKLEEKATKNDEAVEKWLEQAAQAPAERVWVCRESGQVYDHWSPLALPHGSFNTIEWGFPAADMHAMLGGHSNENTQKPILEAPTGT